MLGTTLALSCVIACCHEGRWQEEPHSAGFLLKRPGETRVTSGRTNADAANQLGVPKNEAGGQLPFPSRQGGRMRKSRPGHSTWPGLPVLRARACDRREAGMVTFPASLTLSNLDR